MNEKLKIILFFGSFNPIHIGHTALAQYAIGYLNADEVWFVPTPQNPQKDKENIWDFEKRCEIIRHSICFDKRFKLSMIEKYMPEKCYTYRTLRALKAIYHGYDFHFLMGADTLVGLDSWYRGQEILTEYNLLVYPRNNIDTNKYNGFRNIDIMIDAPLINISSTMIRQHIDERKSVRYFLPNPHIPDITNLY